MKIRLLVVIHFSVILLNACDYSSQNKLDESKKTKETVNHSINAETLENYISDNANILIFTKDYSDKLPYYGKCFTPDKSHIDTCERHIQKLFKYFANPKGKHSIAKYGWDTIYRDLKLYKRQYIGFINNKGDSILHVTAIHQSRIDSCQNWGKEICYYEVFGENIRWEVKFDIKEKDLFEIGGN